MCRKLDAVCHVKEGAKAAIDNQLTSMARQVGKTAADALDAVSARWMRIDSPTVAEATLRGAPEHGETFVRSAPVDFLWHATSGIVFALAVLAVIIGGTRIAWESRGDSARDLLRALLTLVIVTGISTTVIQLLAEASDQFSLWLVQAALPEGVSFREQLGKLLMMEAVEAIGPGGRGQLSMLALVFFAICAFLASLVQVLLMLVRSGMLVLLAGTFPLAASMTNTEVGRTWFKKYCGWIIAFVAYKPAAALVYAGAFKMMEQGLIGGSEDLTGVATGLMMMLLAVLALPALLRLIVPMTAAVSGGSMAMGMSGGEGLATGARSLGRSGAFGGGGSGGGGGPFGGGGGGGATGAIGVGTVMGAAVGGMSKAGGGLAAAAAHSAGEGGAAHGGGKPHSSGGSRRPNRPGARPAPPPPPDPGPSGSG